MRTTWIRQRILTLAIVLCAAAISRADWTPPTDNTLDEKQLVNYIAAAREWSESLKQTMGQVNAAASAPGALAAVAGMDDRLNALLAKHDLSRAQYDWIGQRAVEAFGSLTAVDTLQNTTDQLLNQKKANDEKLATAQQRLTQYEAAQKAGTRLLSDEDRAGIIKDANAASQAALEEARQHRGEASAAEDEAKQHDIDAKVAADAAKNPPAEMTGDDRQGYIDAKTSEAQAARDAAVEARKRQSDDLAAAAASDALIKSAAARAEHPEVPQTDEEKAAAKQEDDNAVAQARSDIDAATAANAQLLSTQAQITLAYADMIKNVPAQNLELMKKHKDEYQQIFSAMPKATQPSN